MSSKRQLPVVKMRIFKPGTQVSYQGQPHNVDHILLTKRGLYLFLDDVLGPVDSERVECAVTEIDFNRGRSQ